MDRMKLNVAKFEDRLEALRGSSEQFNEVSLVIFQLKQFIKKIKKFPLGREREKLISEIPHESAFEKQ